ncbi:EAL domain-containing protein [Comamonadaceae bacterium G21597-S1]|nr:EAL domain-containing protein [Comamonadaceae bacterium G21597-S1]
MRSVVDQRGQMRNGAWPSWLIAALVFVLLLAMGTTLLYRLQVEKQRQERGKIAQMAAERAQVLRRSVEGMLADNRALAALVHQGHGEVVNFEAAASQLLSGGSRVLALSLSPGGVVRHVMPLAGNENLIGFDQLNDPGQRREAVFARDTGRLTLAGPLQLAQGGLGVVSRLPIFLPQPDGENRFWGFSNVTIRLQDLLSAAELGELRARDVEYRLWRVLPDSGEHQIISASHPDPLSEPLRRSLEVPNGAWNLDLAPVGGWGRDPVVPSAAAAMVLASLLLAYLAQLLVEQGRYKAGLEALMRERTAEMLATQNQLRSTVEAIRDPIFEIDLHGNYHSCYAPSDSLLPIPAEDFAGRTVFEVLPAQAAEVTMEALRSAQIDGFSQGEQYTLELVQGTRWYELSVARKQVDGAAVPRFVMMARDITGRKSAKSAIRRLAFYDPLTDLPNRRLLQDRLEHALSATLRSRRFGALLLIDLDNFKALNDTWGHDKGDLLLKQVALRMRACVRDADTVARLGGDEFVVLIDDAGASAADAIATGRRVAEKLLVRLGTPYDIAGREHRSGTSIGVSLFGVDTTTVEEVLKRSDVAMYQAKAAGRNTVRFFDPQMQSAVEARAAMEVDLRSSLSRDDLVLHYQPQVGPGGEVVGAEALLRWTHPERGPVSPGEFIPVAEQSGLIVELGEWVLQRACAQIASWAAHPQTARLTLAINVSVHQFRQADFVDKVRQALEHHRVVPARLKLEITESMFASDQESIINKMRQIKTLGVGFSLDDFGTGYSSLSYLRRLPLDQLKIDQSFVREVLTDPNDAAIARTVIALGQSLGLAVIAEGVELQGQRDFLAAHGCDYCQGYLISRPLPIAQFDRFVMPDAGLDG